MVEITLPRQLECNVLGFEALGHVASQLTVPVGETVLLRGLSQWCDGHLCAPLGALLYAASQNLNSLDFTDEVGSKVLEVWAKNGFWRHFGGVDMSDTFDTTLAFERFDGADEKRFVSYVQGELMPKELPDMTDRAKYRFRHSIQEVFNNAVSHSRTPHGIFCCGQRYPTRDRLSFAVTDLGVGFRQNVEEYSGRPWDAVASIEWALQEGNTTRRGPVPGGMGLSWLLEFMQSNGGELQIVSHEGYWMWRNGRTITNTLRYPFPGTVAILHINTQDTQTHDVQTHDSTAISIF
jgi:hypothetical protein